MRKQEALIFIKENRNFVYLWASQIFSQVAINMINFVMAIRIYEKTGSTLAVSFLWVFYFLPALFLGPFSGYFIDLWDKRKILFYANLLQGATVMLLLFVKGRIFPIYSIIFLYSLLNQFYGPAEAASLPWLVKRKDLSLANSLFMITSQSALILGFGLSGILMRIFGKNNPILICSFGLFLAALAVSRLPKNGQAKKSHAQTFDRFWRGIKAGYLFISSNKIVLFPILLLIAFQVFLVNLGVTIPSFSADLLGIEIQDAGPLLIAPMGLGALCGAYFLSKKFAGKRKKNLIKTGLRISAFIFFFFSLVLPFLGGYKVFFAVPLVFLLGVAVFLIFIPSQTLVQEKTPAFLSGRVLGTLWFAGTVVSLPSLLFSATIVDLLGINLFMFLVGMAMIAGLVLLKRAEKALLIEGNGEM